MIDTDRWSELLVEHLPSHLPLQRWSGANDSTITNVEVEWIEVVAAAEPFLVWALVTATFEDGGQQGYQVFIGARASDPRPDFLEGKDTKVLAEVEEDAADLVLYDALVDPDLAIAVLQLVLPDTEVLVRRPIVLEHSNSSVVFDEATILKVFRKVEPGPNPDVEMTRVLAEQGYPSVLPPIAELRRDGTDLAVVRAYLVEATEGWDLARTSVRDLLASRLPPEESGGDFAPDCERLGATIAGLHVAMATAWGSSPGDPEAWVADMEEHLEELLVAQADALESSGLDSDAVRSRLRQAAATSDGGREIRVHGDLHLAQVMKVDAGWVVVDFEGEPARRRADRFTRSSPLRDVAGILRSFHYAAATGLAEWDLGDRELVDLLEAWERRNREALLEGYFGYEGIDALVPADPAGRAAMLAVFELDKAVYELGYELGHRPDKVSIPLAGIDRLIRGPVAHVSLPTDLDLFLHAEGTHRRLWEVLGSHVAEVGGQAGAEFAVWAPHARHVAVAGPWNHWDVDGRPLQRVGNGVWAGFVPDLGSRTPYKYAITGPDGVTRLHADPMAQFAEHSGGMASIVFESRHVWGDHDWMTTRPHGDPVADRTSVYEVHLGSWRRHPDGRFLGYREVAPLLADHVLELGFTHVELMPVAEHPYGPSWGYQVTGFYAPTSRFGDPDDFRWFVDHLHQRGLGVIVDWVPAHFPRDEGALARFDGAPLYEHVDPGRAAHPDWGTLVFDHERPEVRAFLIANALYWLGELHVDGLRVDAVASMLYLDYSRDDDDWTPNVHGGNEDLGVVAFLQELNTVVHADQPGVLTIAEESTAWSGVSRPVHAGGLGFTHKWNMGWMHDTLNYWSTDPLHRHTRHNQLTFGLTYAWAEHFVLPLSHDEVVHLKKSLLGKMPGPDAAKFANLRALYGWMWAHPGKQLLFMGGELADPHEWSHERGLDWGLLEDPRHAGVQRLVGDLNAIQAHHPALYASDGDPGGFAWLAVDDASQSVLAFERLLPGTDEIVVCIANLKGLDAERYRVGLARPGRWRGLVTTDDARYGGSGSWVPHLEAEPTAWQGRSHSAVLTIPPLTVLYLIPDR